MKTENLQKRFIYLVLISLFALGSSGCGIVSGAFSKVSGIMGTNETATVIAARAQIRSSYAVVAADLLEVKRGVKLDILDETDDEKKVHWYRVRANDDDKTEGWIEAQNVITGALLEKSRKLAEEDKNLLAQATAQIRAPSNLRLSPEQKDDNILFKLDYGSTFEITDWKYVPKAQDASDVDDAKNATNKPGRPRTKNEEIEAAKEANKPEELDDKYDIWYKVRLDPAVSPAPSGWIFGRQVELQVPTDISFFQIGALKFVTWQRLDDVDPKEKANSHDAASKVSKPGSWIILSRSNKVLSTDGNEPDFDGILVLGYDKYNEDHYTIYKRGETWRNGAIQGNVPLKLEGSGDNKAIVLSIRNAAGQMEEKRFAVFKDPKGKLKVTPPPDL